MFLKTHNFIIVIKSVITPYPEWPFFIVNSQFLVNVQSSCRFNLLSLSLLGSPVFFIDGHKRKNRMEHSHARVSIVVNVFMPRFELNSGPLQSGNALCPIKHIQLARAQMKTIRFSRFYRRLDFIVGARSK